MTNTTAEVTPKPPKFKLALPTAPAKLRQWLLDVAVRKDLFQNGRMQPLTDTEVVEVLGAGLKFLQEVEENRLKEQRGYLMNRFGTVLVGLDAAQPAEGDVVIVERGDGGREQCIVEGGYAWLWRNGSKGVKFCAAAKIVRWRQCEMPNHPVRTEGEGDFVLEAMAKGKAMMGNGDGLANRPGAGAVTSKVVRK